MTSRPVRPSVRPSIRPFHEINPLTRLAICWILGALAARAYEKVAFSEYPTAVGRTLKGGAFAAGLLILATQLRLASDGLAGPVDPDVVSAPTYYMNLYTSNFQVSSFSIKRVDYFQSAFRTHHAMKCVSTLGTWPVIINYWSN